jgi:hypothetical protein
MAARCANATVAFFKLPQLPQPANPAHNNTMRLIILIVLAAPALAGLAYAWRPTRGTTLRAAWWWSVAAVVAVALTDAATGESAAGASARFAAAILTFCPAVALFGAKRPQDRAWQWIVLAFWGILSLPAAEALVFSPHEPPQPHPVWSWFLMGLIVVGCANYLFTRYWLSGLAVAAAQCVLLHSYLPFSHGESVTKPGAGLSMLMGAILLPALGLPRRVKPRNPLDRLWRDFRDQYGVVWALRIAERINASAHMYNWPVQLDWHGFQNAPLAAVDRPPDSRAVDRTPRAVDRSPDRSTGPTEGLPAQPLALTLQPSAELDQAFRSLLRRFVSPEWIERRLGSDSRGV